MCVQHNAGNHNHWDAKHEPSYGRIEKHVTSLQRLASRIQTYCNRESTPLLETGYLPHFA
jgi:hypothetical protein